MVPYNSKAAFDINRTFTFIMVFLLTTTIVISIEGKSYGASADNWYVGKGIQPNTYLSYRIQEHDTNSGRPFLMTIYFEQFNNTGHYWLAPVYVVTPGGEVLNGTFHLSDLDLSVLGSSEVPNKLSPYVSAYTSSIHWLASFVPKPGQSLSAPYWGKIAAIGGQAIAPSGSAKVTVPAGSFDTRVVSWHKGKDNNIWVSPNIPYPVKAQTFADVTTGNPPIQYAFDLLAKGQGKPPIPKSQIEIPKPPLTIQTARGTYYITLVWEPQVIQAGRDTKFGVVFKDNSQHTISQVSYSFKVTDANGTVLKDVKNQKAPDGTGIQTVKFEKSGPASVLVSIDAVAGQPSGVFVENARFQVVVVGTAAGGREESSTAANSSRLAGQTNQTNVRTTNTPSVNASSPATVPEFPHIAPPVILMAAIIGLAVFMTRTKRFGMRRDSGL